MNLTAVSAGAAMALELDPQIPSCPEPAVPDLRAGGRAASSAAVARLTAVAPAAGADPMSLAGLGACIEDARAATLSRRNAPQAPMSFAMLRGRLEVAAAKLPPTYREAVADPLLRSLDRLGPRGFARVLAEDPAQEGEARLLLDLSRAVLQRGEGFAARETKAFQEVVSDLYDGFLSAESRRGVKPPDREVVAPIVCWGGPDDGPYTWSVAATSSLGAEAAMVSLPVTHARGGILAWPALAHETAGHDVLGADVGLRDELARAVRQGLRKEGLGADVADYWADRIDEVAADVMGVLNMGPSAAVGLIGYFRAVNGAWRGRPQLRNVGRAEDSHPADIARAYLAAESVRQLSFRGAGAWADRLLAEADRDLGRVWLGKSEVSEEVAKSSAAAVARIVSRTRMASLEGRALGEIQDWRDSDEAVVAELRGVMRNATGSRVSWGRGAAAGKGPGAYAAHAVAAGVYEAVSSSSTPEKAMGGMISVLAAMHRENPAWSGSAA